MPDWMFEEPHYYCIPSVGIDKPCSVVYLMKKPLKPLDPVKIARKRNVIVANSLVWEYCCQVDKEESSDAFSEEVVELSY